MDLVEFARENWAVIRQAPWVFVTFAIIGLALEWVVLSYLKANRIADLIGRLSFRDDEIASLKNKLAASPEQAKANLAVAESRKMDAFRELAWIPARFVIYAMQEALQGRWLPDVETSFQICRSSIDRVDFAEITPRALIEWFTFIENMTLRAESLVRERSTDQEAIRQVLTTTRYAMSRIDRALAA